MTLLPVVHDGRAREQRRGDGRTPSKRRALAFYRRLFGQRLSVLSFRAGLACLAWLSHLLTVSHGQEGGSRGA